MPATKRRTLSLLPPKRQKFEVLTREHLLAIQQAEKLTPERQGAWQAMCDRLRAKYPRA